MSADSTATGRPSPRSTGEAVDEASHGPEGISEINLMLIMVGLVAVATAFPFKPVKYGVIAVFGVLFILQTMRRPAMGFALLAFGVPAIDLVPPDLIPLRGLNAEFLVGAGLVFIWVRANQLYGKDEISSPVSRMLVAYALMIIASCFFSWMIWQYSLFNLLAAAKNHMTCMLFFPAALHSLRTRRDQYLLIGAASLSMLLNCLQAIDHSWLAFVTGTLERRRAQALVALQPNLLGAILVLYLPVFMMLAFNAVGTKLSRFYFLIATMAGGFALLLTLSRGAWLGFIPVLLFLGIYRSRKLLVLIILLAATSQLWVPEQIWERVLDTKHDSGRDLVATGQVADGSTQMRIEQYKSLPAMMAPKPIFGWGYLSFSKVFERYGTLGRAKGAHSSYCLLGTEQGLIGLGLFLTLFFTMFWSAFQASRIVEDPFTRWMAVGLAGGILGFMVCMASGSRFDAQKSLAFFWIFLAIVERERLLALAQRKPERPVPLGPVN